MFTDALKSCAGMLDPYGDMPLAGGMTAFADIEIIDTDNGVRVSVTKTPPRDGKIRLSDMLESILGPQNGLECAADQGKCKPEKDGEKPDDSGKMGNRKPPEPLDDAKPGNKPTGSTDASGQKDDKDRWRKEKPE